MLIIKHSSVINRSIDHIDIGNYTEIYCVGCTSLTHLPAWPNVTHVYCGDCISLTQLPLWPKITHVYCRDCTGLTQLPLWPKIQYIDCTCCTSLTQLPKWSNTTQVYYHGCTGLTQNVAATDKSSFYDNFFLKCVELIEKEETKYKKYIQSLLDSNDLDQIEAISYNVYEDHFMDVEYSCSKEFYEKWSNEHDMSKFKIFNTDKFTEYLKNDSYFDYLSGPKINYSQDCNGGYLHTTISWIVTHLHKFKFVLCFENTFNRNCDEPYIHQDCNVYIYSLKKF